MFSAANASGSLNALSLDLICLKAILFDCGGNSFQASIYLLFVIAFASDIGGRADLQCSHKLPSRLAANRVYIYKR